jgi:DNA-binding NarL/FixJ family response regulator
MTVVQVLLVDDQEPFLRAKSAVVEEALGFEFVGEASSGEESILAAAQLVPDLVLMDVNLPGIDGLEATRRLRRLQLPPVVFLLSTYDDDAGARFLAECGAAAYVTKSAFGPDQLRGMWTGRPTAASCGVESCIRTGPVARVPVRVPRRTRGRLGP